MSKSSVNLPKTSFSMRANLPLKEPDLIDYWNKISLYEKLRANSKGNKKFVFGMEEMSIQKPIVRNYSWEILFHDLLKEEGIIGLDIVPIKFF